MNIKQQEDKKNCELQGSKEKNLPLKIQIKFAEPEFITIASGDIVKLEPQEDNPETMKCFHCEFEATDVDSLQGHLVEHVPEKIEGCAHCDSLALTQPEDFSKGKADCDKHLSLEEPILKKFASLHQPKDDEFSCFYCSFQAENDSILINHILMFHSDDKKFKCNYCDFKTTQKKFLDRHVSYKHHQTDKKFSCSYCDFKTKLKGDLKRHVLRHQPDSVELSCDFCDYKTIQKRNLSRHMLYHGPDGKKLSCDYCDYKTIRMAHLKRHMLRHKPSSKLSCDYCDYKAVRKDNLKRHILCRHPNKKN